MSKVDRAYKRAMKGPFYWVESTWVQVVGGVLILFGPVLVFLLIWLVQGMPNDDTMCVPFYSC